MDNEAVKEVLKRLFTYMQFEEWRDELYANYETDSKKVFNAFTDLIVSQNNRIVELENKVTQLEESQNPEGSMTLQGYIVP